MEQVNRVLPENALNRSNVSDSASTPKAILRACLGASPDGQTGLAEKEFQKHEELPCPILQGETDERQQIDTHLYGFGRNVVAASRRPGRTRKPERHARQERKCKEDHRMLGERRQRQRVPGER